MLPWSGIAHRRCRTPFRQASVRWRRSWASTMRALPRPLARTPRRAGGRPVNFNAPGQIVIAGHREAGTRHRRGQGERREAGVLPVSAPFHSSLLRPVAGPGLISPTARNDADHSRRSQCGRGHGAGRSVNTGGAGQTSRESGALGGNSAGFRRCWRHARLRMRTGPSPDRVVQADRAGPERHADERRRGDRGRACGKPV